MPIYLFGCCGMEVEVIQGIDKETPLCPDCGAEMKRLLTTPAIITIKDKGGTRTYSKGYKEDYAKDYQSRLQDKKYDDARRRVEKKLKVAKS